MIYKEKILLSRNEGDFKIGFCILKKNLPDILNYIDLLHEEEIAYYSTLKFDKRKTSYLQGRIAAKHAISELVQDNQTLNSISIKFGVFQFPVVKNLANKNIQISISHSDEYGIACAFPEEHPIGIDIQKINNDLDIMANYVFEKESQQIASCSLEKKIGNTLIWASKESLSKILKTGLTLDFKIMEINSIFKKEGCYVCHFKNFTQYKSISKSIDGYVCSVVLPRRTSSVLIMSLFENIEKHIGCVK
ncbi:hypothetical protein A8C32_11535 [Flavivirga aquatica]|uniref:4'-phosphopantetheinyl transferase domain-containing protein n=1 Tax=Flavivirga aquatica TaxID=1849968 RepID=A0A1E5TDA0_9FLAO|nr:4'-phosphopantetheinyl transferase superfamily protein [Flavivirga aquatica]OEK09345.1 hypothetical protein A8C32_11535 [Flavivirga aquatica]